MGKKLFHQRGDSTTKLNKKATTCSALREKEMSTFRGRGSGDRALPERGLTSRCPTQGKEEPAFRGKRSQEKRSKAAEKRKKGGGLCSGQSHRNPFRKRSTIA